MRIEIRGAVQGVGFRPFVYRVAREMNLRGWIVNSPQGVSIEAEGEHNELRTFIMRLENESPPRSFLQSKEYAWLDPIGYDAFEIRESKTTGEVTALVLPDIATCPECLAEVFDPANRRYLYPFTNCTNCGPRFSIIEALPYDRSKTTMKAFAMCKKCKEEYDDPENRRFHAQPNACPDCGPHVALWDTSGKAISFRHDAILSACEAVRSGKIVAVKGIGGFHLVVDALNDEAVRRLRERKHREEKPLALMFPSLEVIHQECVVSEADGQLLQSPESPIVLLQRRSSRSNETTRVSPLVAPRNPSFGAMLPYSPLHHIMVRELARPIVATSGNATDEPICTDERDAVVRLRGIADLFLVHNRLIARHVDDSIVRVVLDRPMMLRRARGYAPLPIQTNTRPANSSLLAFGAHLKNTIALSKGNTIFISQHIGDLETTQASVAFKHVIESFKTLYEASPQAVLADQHPDYLSTQHAQTQPLPAHYIQHHYAHVASCMAENQLDGTVLGVSWDGTGFGPDGTIWGGEFLLTNETSFERVATFRRFPLPGGDRAVREPRRTAFGLLHEMFGKNLYDQNRASFLRAFSAQERVLIRQMLEKKINSPYTSSAGRLFDAVAAIIGVQDTVSFEGQAAMEMEFLTSGVNTDAAYPFSSMPINGSPLKVIDWAPMISCIINDHRCGIPGSLISTKFHNTLAEIIVQIARQIGEERVVLSGGCFQNTYLLEHSVRRLDAEGFRTYRHQRVPPHDGGISLGQVYAFQRAQRAVAVHSDHEPAFTSEGME